MNSDFAYPGLYLLISVLLLTCAFVADIYILKLISGPMFGFGILVILYTIYENCKKQKEDDVPVASPSIVYYNPGFNPRGILQASIDRQTAELV